MRTLLAIGMLIGCAAIADGQEQESRFPLYRSPNQKQADYLRSQTPHRYVAPTVTIRQPRWYGYGYRGPYGYGYGYPSRYGYYGRPRYPVYVYPPVVRPWPVSPYPFQIP